MKLFLLVLILFGIFFMIWNASNYQQQLGGGHLKESMKNIDNLLKEFTI